jgi:hypothetical protein
MRYIYSTLLAVCFAVGACAQPVKKLLLMGIDGCRPDAMLAANTPALDSLMAHGTFSLDAQTIFPTISGPGWSSMLTGVWYTKHGVTDNTFNNSNYAQYPHFFTHLKQFDISLYTASISQWAPINTYIVDSCDHVVNTGTTSATADSAVALLSTADPDVVFLHFDDVDHAGHSTGFSPTNPDYIDAIEHVDSAIARVVAAVMARPTYSNEEWLIMVSTDHGGTGTSHGGNSNEERTIFLIMQGGGLPVQQLVPAVSNSGTSVAISYNGTDEYSSINTSPDYDFGTSTDFTIECRVLTNGWTGDPAIVSDKNWNSGYNKGFVLAGRTDGTTWKVNLGDSLNRIDINGGTINDGQYHHLSFSVQRNGLAKIFQDGVFIGSTSATGIGDVYPNLPIGLAQDGTHTYANFFNGVIDEVRIWNKAINDTMIADWSCQNVTAMHPDIANLVGYWKCNENTGAVAYDSSGNGNSATLMNTPTWVMPTQQVQCVDYSNLPRMVDIAPTAMKYFCLPIDTAWHLDGHPLSTFDCDTPLAVVTVQANSFDVTIYPNPATGYIAISSNNEIHEVVISNTLGQVLLREGGKGYKSELNIASLQPGVYFISTRDAYDRVVVKKVVKE